MKRWETLLNRFRQTVLFPLLARIRSLYEKILHRQAGGEMIADNIRAVPPIYFAAMLEELKVFQVVARLVELFQNGNLPIGRGPAGDRLHAYWKESAARMSDAERRGVYARTLGISDSADGGVNREFPDLWQRFVSSVSSLVRQKTADRPDAQSVVVAVTAQEVKQAGRDLAANLSRHGGSARLAAVELQREIKNLIGLLSDSEIRSAFGARDMWEVIDQVAAIELGGAKNTVRYRTLATSGGIVISWLANNVTKLSASSLDPILNIEDMGAPAPPAHDREPITDPSDYDLVIACEQWLAVSGVEGGCLQKAPA